MLEHCETFLRQASPTVRAEMHAYLDEHTGADAGWLIDMTGFHCLFLQAKLAVAAEANTATSEVTS